SSAGADKRIRPEPSQAFDPALYGDEDGTAILFSPRDVERVPLLLEVVHLPGIAGVNAQRHEIPPFHERQALQDELHPVFPLEDGDPDLATVAVRPEDDVV